MKTINQIGNYAMERIFCQKDDPMSNQSREFKISKDVFDLMTTPSNPFRTDKMGVRYCSGTSYLVWGIKLGLKNLELDTRRTLLNQIAEFEEIPSHLVREWSSEDYTGEKEVYTVHRLTQAQEERIAAFHEKYKEWLKTFN